MLEQTISYSPKAGHPRLIIFFDGTIIEKSLEGQQEFGRPSRKKMPDISIPSGVISRNHGIFQTRMGRCFYRDTDSLNGTIYNGTILAGGVLQELMDGDVLRIHGREDENCEMDVVMIYTTLEAGKRQWRRMALDEAAEICIGRKAALKLKDQSVSRMHASFFLARKGWALIDHGSLNGVYRNGSRIGNPVYLKPNDVVRITDYYFIYTGKELIFQDDIAEVLQTQIEESEIRHRQNDDQKNELRKTEDVQVETPASHEKKYAEADPGLSIHIEERNVWHRARKKTLLRDINLEIPASSMVLILGGSGAGKTTFMNAVMGYEQAEGSIRYAGTDIYEEYEKMKYEIGYVPQQDLLRMNDSVVDTLHNAARMRLPKMKKDQYMERVEETMHLLGLERLRDSMVGKLSGGQRKRLSIAVEYIGNPSLFFLDEPDSGLDGTMARQLMENLRLIADKGKIVLVISHSPDRAFELFDRIIVLAKSSKEEGRLVFYGSPEEALTFFEVDSLESIVSRINYPEEGGEGLADYFVGRFQESMK